MIHFCKINTIFSNAFTRYKAKGDRQPLEIVATKNRHIFKLQCITDNNAFISSHSFSYKRALELAEKFYADMNKNKLFQVR